MGRDEGWRVMLALSQLLVLSHLLVAQATPAYLASCPAEPGRLVTPAIFIPPNDVHATNRRARFFIDLGSDGRVRRAAVVESSGDPHFDGAAQAALMSSAKYAPPEQNCISSSSVTMESFNVPLISLVTPAPAGASAPPAIPTSAPAASIAICAAEFVQLTSIDVPDEKSTARHRQYRCRAECRRQSYERAARKNQRNESAR